MKIVNLVGGLGNQMFEYAFYLALREAHPLETIKVCTRSYRNYNLHNGLEIERIFGVDLPEATTYELCRLAYPFFNYRTWQVMRHLLPHRQTMTRGGFDVPFDFSQITRNDSVYYEGYWQNEKNFKHIRKTILKSYTFPEFTEPENIELMNKLVTKNAVSCHVRRGDYLQNQNMCVCTSQYYTRAIKLASSLLSPDLFLFFSDDLPWCKRHFRELLSDKNVIFVDWNLGEHSFRDMQLMSLCRHNIIANSSFSWWGAWLNNHDDKMVIAPESFSRITPLNDPICEGWKRISSH